MTHKAEDSILADRPTEPTSTAIEPSSNLPSVPSVIPAPGAVCAACKQSNHVGAPQCAFCGEVLTLPTVRDGGAGRWAEGPDSEDERESMPSFRRATMVSEFDEMPQAPIADPLIGVVVADRYRIKEGLGRGGMGIVYKVEHTRIGKLLAMKLLTGELSRNPEVVRRFKHEALTSSKLSSPCTVQVFDFGVSDGLTYLVMELVGGEDLGKSLRASGPIPFSRLGKIIIQVCTSLAEAHGKGIVHRDVKPENIMLVRSRDGADVAKVLDFGLAKLREGSDLNDMTSQGAIVGTPYFMAPEQVRGEPVDARADIYALGGVMYRALTGHYPFSGPTPMSVFTKHLTELPVPLTERAPDLDIPPGVNDIVLRALAKSPSDRFQKVEDLEAALIDELRVLGPSSIEAFLESRAVRELAKTAPHAVPEAAQGTSAPAVAIATRDEVEAYERKLRMQRWYALVVTVGLTAGIAAGGWRWWTTRPTEFTGVEVEPNDTPGDATRIPLGRSVSGFLGKRIDASTGDRDFYAFEVKPTSPAASPYVHLTTTALPNFAMCTLLYKQGLATPLAQYCVGRPRRDLDIPVLALEPGKYLAAILQDRDPYGASAPPYVHENVSDSYQFKIEATEPDDKTEIEPNDQIASANPMKPNQTLGGRIAWAHDEDIFCAAGGTVGRVRFKVRDVQRDAGAVLEVTPFSAGEEGAPVRVHASGKGAITMNDVTSPWIEPLVGADIQRCLRLRLVDDPWVPGSGSAPTGGTEPYEIQLEAQ